MSSDFTEAEAGGAPPYPRVPLDAELDEAAERGFTATLYWSLGGR